MIRLANISHSEAPPPSIWGEPGDQLKDPDYASADLFKGELEICPWYDGDWLYCYRATDAKLARDIARIAEKVVRNPLVGYSQNNEAYPRTGLYKALMKANYDPDLIDDKCNTDCSAGSAAIINAAGVNISMDMWTGNADQLIMRTGRFSRLTDPRFLVTSDYLRAGDILLRPATIDRGGHMTIVIDSSYYGEASAIKYDVKIGTWNIRRDPDLTAPVIERVKSGYDVSVTLPWVQDPATEYRQWIPVIWRGYYQGWMSIISLDPMVPYQTTGSVWMRRSPSLKGERMQVLDAGEIVPGGSESVDERGVKWVESIYNNMRGWVSSKYLKEV